MAQALDADLNRVALFHLVAEHGGACDGAHLRAGRPYGGELLVRQEPLAHPLALTRVAIEFIVDRKKRSVRCEATVATLDRTGVEMEALTAVATGLLTVYDMCKAVDRGMRMLDIGLVEKKGGKSGHWLRKSAD